MFLVHCTSQHLCMRLEVSSFINFEVMLLTRFRDTQTDRRTDLRMDRVTPEYPLHLGINIASFLSLNIFILH